MNKYWKKRSQDEINETIFSALKENINYVDQYVLGIPASYLDDKVFNQDASFLKDAPYISTLIQNPNHIGCHTLGKSESFFKGTQEIEKRVIDICAVDILKCEEEAYDGYVASGGTEANIQAIWIYRNYFRREFNASDDEIVILCSTDSHYSMPKAANLLSIDISRVEVHKNSRQLNIEALDSNVQDLMSGGKKYFIVVCNMMTTMFGSVDLADDYTEVLDKYNCNYKMHVDGAYGGFYFPFAEEKNLLTFLNPKISSFTLDAHKMAQAPYGTGIFLIRKGLIQNVNTQLASYVEGEDFTLIGSRSGANAIAVWMILVKNGPFGWEEKVFILQKRTDWICKQLDDLKIAYYRHPKSNIVTIRSEFVSDEVANKFGLVPDNHNAPNWYKIVIMEHVTIEKLSLLIEDLSA